VGLPRLAEAMVNAGKLDISESDMHEDAVNDEPEGSFNFSYYTGQQYNIKGSATLVPGVFIRKDCDYRHQEQF